MTVAEPIPPPAHMAATPIPPPRRRNSCTRVTSILAPVAATGCPSEQPLPLTLTWSGSRSSSLMVAKHIGAGKPDAGKGFRDGLDRSQAGDRGVDPDGRPGPYGGQGGQPERVARDG